MKRARQNFLTRIDSAHRTLGDIKGTQFVGADNITLRVLTDGNSEYDLELTVAPNSSNFIRTYFYYDAFRPIYPHHDATEIKPYLYVGTDGNEASIQRYNGGHLLIYFSEQVDGEIYAVITMQLINSSTEAKRVRYKAYAYTTYPYTPSWEHYIY